MTNAIRSAAAEASHGTSVRCDVASAPPDSDADRRSCCRSCLRSITGGVERGTVEIAQAIAEAEATALVASAGGPLVRQIERAGGIHITLPLTTKSPVRHLAQRRRTGNG